MRAEADLRFSLVRVNEHVDDISLAEGEADENAASNASWHVLAARRAASSWESCNLTWVTGALVGSR